MEQRTHGRLTPADAEARDKRMGEAAINVTTPATATDTLLTRRAQPRDEFAVERGDDG